MLLLGYARLRKPRSDLSLLEMNGLARAHPVSRKIL